MVRPTPAPRAPAPRTGTYAGLISGLRGRFPGTPVLHRDLLAAGTLDNMLAALHEVVRYQRYPVRII